jgi:hypothetical protein
MFRVRESNFEIMCPIKDATAKIFCSRICIDGVALKRQSKKQSDDASWE